MEERIETFEQFWPHYVRAHAMPGTRMLRFVGTTTALATVALGLVTRRRWLVALAPALGNAPRWFSRAFMGEDISMPQAHPLWSLRANLTMVAKMLDGTMDDEVERVMKRTGAKAGSNGESKTVRVDLAAHRRREPSTLN